MKAKAKRQAHAKKLRFIFHPNNCFLLSPETSSPSPEQYESSENLPGPVVAKAANRITYRAALIGTLYHSTPARKPLYIAHAQANDESEAVNSVKNPAVTEKATIDKMTSGHTRPACKTKICSAPDCFSVKRRMNESSTPMRSTRSPKSNAQFVDTSNRRADLDCSKLSIANLPQPVNDSARKLMQK
jgi:hypothetical protein